MLRLTAPLCLNLVPIETFRLQALAEVSESGSDRQPPIWLVEPASQLQEEPVYPTVGPWYQLMMMRCTSLTLGNRNIGCY
jgi:hypothetical protein